MLNDTLVILVVLCSILVHCPLSCVSWRSRHFTITIQSRIFSKSFGEIYTHCVATVKYFGGIFFLRIRTSYEFRVMNSE